MPLLLQGFGGRLLIDGNLPKNAASGLRECLPSQVSIAQVDEPVPFDRRLTVAITESAALLMCDDTVLATARCAEALMDSLRAHLELSIAAFAQNVTFVHAGVVSWAGVAILLPGTSQAGKSTLVAELVRRGAEYYSDEYAVVDRDGLVFPYPRSIRLRSATAPLNPRIGSEPLPAALIVATAYRAGSTWAPVVLKGARAALPILDNVIVIRDRPEQGLRLAAQLATHSVTLQGLRPEATEVAPWILEFVGGGFVGSARP